MSLLKLATIIGTRPEIIKLSEIIRKCDLCFEHTLAHTGQNYDYTLNDIFFEELNLRKPDHYLNVIGSDLGKTIGNIIAKSYAWLSAEKPDALLVLGDTNSCLAVMAAKRLKIPIFHLEAGNRCFDENLPEEVNRRVIDHISDINLAYSEHARRNLHDEGIRKEFTFVVGSPMAEVIKANEEKINTSEILNKLGLAPGKYILLSAHREENIDNELNFFSLMNAINTLAANYNLPIIYSTHPRSAQQINKKDFKFHSLVRNLKPFGFFDYINLQKNALCVVSDSGTLAEEASYFHFPAVSARTSTERPEAIDKGNIILGTLNSDNILNAVEQAIKLNKNNCQGETVSDYQGTITSTKVVNIIQSYTSIVNKTVWNKSNY